MQRADFVLYQALGCGDFAWHQICSGLLPVFASKSKTIIREPFMPIKPSQSKSTAIAISSDRASRQTTRQTNRCASLLRTMLIVIAIFASLLLGQHFGQRADAAINDFNVDAKSDLVFSNNNGQVDLWLMNGLTAASKTTLLNAPGWSITHIADFDGDGKADILWRNENGAVNLWLMNGTQVSSAIGILGPDANWRVTHVGDFNGDGKADILWRNTDGSVTMWMMNGGVVASAVGLLGADANWSVTHAADFNADGKADLLWRHTNGAVTQWIMNGGIVAGAKAFLGPDDNWSVSHTSDFNGDGKADLLWRHTNGAVNMWLINGAVVVSSAAILGATPDWSVSHVADFNGDGKADLLWRNTNGAVTMWIMNGTVSTSASGVLGSDPYWRVIQTPDLNGDGKADLLWRHVNGAMTAWLMNGGTITSNAMIADAGGWTASIDPVPSAVAQAKNNASRFLAQATFGPRTADVNALIASGIDVWFAQQFAAAPRSHLTYIEEAKARRIAASTDGKGDFQDTDSYQAIWQQWLWGPDQLRARMAFALSEIMVISNTAPDIYPEAMSSYMDTLNKYAFSTYRELLEAVALQPAMGYYLNMMGSEKEDTIRNIRPNENFAREVLQLFSVGLYQLNSDGTRKLDGAGKTIATYDEDVVKGFAQAFSGWNFAGNDTTKPDSFDNPKEDWRTPLLAWPSKHSTGTKKLLNGVTLAAGQSPQADMKAALDNIANHPNVAPFISRQLIQRFVTSNPSPAYIARVAGVFENNGRGVRGDLASVIKVILIDPEARSAATSANGGKQREPVIRFANILRALDGKSKNGLNGIDYLDSADNALGQSPLLAPSVFNFFSPNYTRPGKLAAAGMVAPEFQITNEIQTIGTANFFYNLVRDGGYGYGDNRIELDFTDAKAVANDPVKLVDYLEAKFTYGQLSPAMRQVMTQSVAEMPYDTSDWSKTLRIRTALTLLALSSDFVIQK
jgi:uncharacterized protein (DUF1800 family)